MRNLVEQFWMMTAYVDIAQRNAEGFAENERLRRVQEEVENMAEVIGTDKPVWTNDDNQEVTK